MTRPGPKPLPTPIRILHNNPSNRPLPENEPKPERCENLEPPDWMADENTYMMAEKFPVKEVARRVWDAIAPQLDLLGVLTTIDRDKLARYCDTFARWLKTKAWLDKNGETFPIYVNVFEPVKQKDGSTKYEPRKQLKRIQTFPQVALYTKLTELLRKYEEEFGIGAASRTRIQTIMKAPPNPASKGEGGRFDYASRKQA